MAKGKKATETQPAKVSYFFGPGWKDLGQYIKLLWKNIRKKCRKCHKDYSSESLLTVKGLFFLVVSISCALFGGLFGGIISALSATILSLFFFLVYAGFGIARLTDTGHLKIRKIYTACPVCKRKSLIPVYQCPNCHAEHTDLRPGRYGILYRKCSCGTKMPTHFVTGRKNLKALCPYCKSDIADRENVVLSVPVVGARSTGKTAFITAFSKDFIEKTAPSLGWKTSFYDGKKEKIFEQIRADYSHGSTRMTERTKNLEGTSSVSFSFFLKGRGLSTERLLHIYDIPGEVFIDGSENEIPYHYEYCQGIVLMLDPFSVPEVQTRFGHLLTAEDKAGIGRTDADTVLDAFSGKIREVTGLSVEKLYDTPIAVVLSKADQPGVREYLGEEAVKRAQKELLKQGIKNVSRADAEDYACRQFLKEMGMQHVLKSMERLSRKHRYFACSAIGHTRDRGAYTPKGVSAPMEWLLTGADPALAKKWNTQTFGKVPVKEG